jgi:hypothetical protein
LLEADSGMIQQHRNGGVSNVWRRCFFVVDGVNELPDSSLRSE